ncbi:hypothetical protein EIJ81_00910 (plasmid) [Aliivibrio salmonicida]|uniref:hypothetical protein n=1 Tax=Aliivibrio salmonicida TaxID=40269 RepID=UPI000F6EDFD5|nr:hypothetical protein [Aliivibrio salmonicida]AZL83460.1 hypothetical protein EIJ81_00910 [Aliivibrio salmonicida]
MKKNLLAIAMASALFGCASPMEVAQPAADTTAQINAKVTAAQLALMPAWYLDPPKSSYKRGIFVVATASNEDVQFAINQAVLLAEQKVAKQINSEVTSFESNVISNNGGSNSYSSEQQIEVQVKPTAIYGHQVVKREIFPDPKTGDFRVYVQVHLPAKAQIDLLNEKYDTRKSNNKTEALQDYIGELEKAQVEVNKSDEEQPSKVISISA